MKFTRGLKIALVSLLSVSVLGLGGCGAAQNSAASSSASAKKPIKMNLGITLTMDNHYGIMASKFAELVKQKTNGGIEVNVFPSSQLGGEVQMIQAARAGSQDMLVTAQAVLENTVKEWSIFDIPYLFDSVEQGNKVMAKGKVPEEFLNMLPKYNLVGFGFLSLMEREVFSSKPINTVADMKGMKIRVMQAPGYVAAYNALGADPTPMAYNEVYVALQQGVVDGADTSPDQFMQDKFVEVAKYYNITKVHYLPAVLLMSKQRFDSLSPEYQKAVTEAANEALDYARGIYVDQYNKAISDMQARGVKVNKPDLTEFKAKAQEVVPKLLKDIPRGQELYNMIEDAKKSA